MKEGPIPTDESGNSAPSPDGRGRVDDTYQRLKSSILEGELHPGMVLTEFQIAEAHGVSRTPVREALTRLQQDGLVERGERGLVVRERSPEQILDIYEVRILLEGAVAAVAAERHNSFDKIRLENALRRADGLDTDNVSGLVRANRTFHEAVWTASHNDAMIDLLSRLNLHVGRYPATTLAYPGRWHVACGEHRNIADAILARDSERAEILAREHFTAARDIRLKLWADDTY